MKETQEETQEQTFVEGTTAAHQANKKYTDVEELQRRITELEQQNKTFLYQNQELLKKIENSSLTSATDCNTIELLLSKYFTPGQVKSILSYNKRVKWSSEYIASAISLRSVSPKCCGKN